MKPNLSVLLMVLPGVWRPTAEEMEVRLSPFYRRHDPPDASADDALDPGDGMAPVPRGWTQGWVSPEGDPQSVTLLPFSPAWIDGPLLCSRLPRKTVRAARAARWALWCATELHPADPLAAYGRQMRFASTAAPEAVAVHDHDSQRVVAADRFHAVASWTTPPPPAELFHVHAVAPEAKGEGFWVHTHGLARAGMPDVELLRVPPDVVPAAADLLSAFVRAALGTKVEERGRSDDIVLGHELAWIPAAEASARLPPCDGGGESDRKAAPSHSGRRLVLVGDDRPAALPDPPLDVLRAFDDTSALVRVHPREAQRAARLARERWSLFVELFDAHGHDRRWSFVVCVAMATRCGGRESLWWVVEELRDGRLRGQVRNAPVAVEGLAALDERWLDAARVDDWVIYAPGRDVTPATVFPSAREALR